METETHYNYFRDYDSRIGRYAQSDPVGLKGGVNTYGYVRGNPLRRVDAMGLRDGPAFDLDRPFPHPDYRPPNPNDAMDYLQCLAKCKATMALVCLPVQGLGALAGVSIGTVAGSAGGPAGAGAGAAWGGDIGYGASFAFCQYISKKQCDSECPKNNPNMCTP